MKRFLLFAAIVAWFGSDGARGQTTQIAPDCFFYVSYTVASNTITNVNGQSTSNGRWPQAGYNNGNNGCVAWTVTYYDSDNSALTALSLAFESAPDNAGAAGSWGSFVGTIISGINPNTSNTNAFTTFTGYNKWVSVNLSGLTGTGNVQVYAYGCRSLTCAPLVTAATGGGNVTIVAPLGQTTMSASIPVTVASDQSPLGELLSCSSSAEVPLSGTGYTEIVAGTAAQVIHVCKVFVTSAATGTPSVNTFSIARATVSTCASPTEMVLAAGVTGIDSDYGGALRSAASQSICVSETVANSDKVTITYAKY